MSNLIDELWVSIEQNPTDVGAYAVLGDRMQEAGDPHGELIAVQCALESEKNRTKKKALRTQSDALIKKQSEVLLGSLAGRPEAEVELGWFCGHVREVTLRGADAAKVVERLHALLALPVARVLQGLTVALRPARVFGDDRGYAEPYGPIFAALTAQGTKRPKTLRSLALGDGEHDLITGHIRVPNFAVALLPLEQFETLTITAGSATPGASGLPKLRQLALHLSNMESRSYPAPTSATLDEIANASWPSLERLELWFGAREICYINSDLDEVRRRGRKYAEDMTLRQIQNLDVMDWTPLRWETLQPRLPSLVPPSVTWLGLGNLSFTDTLVEHLPQMPWWSRLRVLDLSHGTLSHKGAQTLVSQAAAYAHLETLVLDGNTLVEEDIASILAVLPQARADKQRIPQPQPAFMSRYVSSVE